MKRKTTKREKENILRNYDPGGHVVKLKQRQKIIKTLSIFWTAFD